MPVSLAPGTMVDRYTLFRTNSRSAQHMLHGKANDIFTGADCHLLCRLFELPIALALTAGFIQSAISPTVLVTGMLELQRRGYGQAKGKLWAVGRTMSSVTA